ncbi:MAG: trigger factor [Rhodoferax sp.]|nr:trigger factor [Rhodoferax sp.]
MAVTVETLEKLERKITLTLPAYSIHNEVQARLRKLGRRVRMDGFRPGKVPIDVVNQRYGSSVYVEVLNDKLLEAFGLAAKEASLRVASQPQITETSSAPEGHLAFDAVFEVFPEVNIGDIASLAVEKISTEVTDSAIDKTLEILRKQRRTFSQRPVDAAGQDGDRITADFEGTINGEAFEGSKATDFRFIVGDGQMLKGFEEATLGMKAGESKTFALTFPDDYPSEDVAGKTADFMLTVKKIEATHLPEVDAVFAKSLGIADASVEGLRADIQKNLQREIKTRLHIRNRQAVLETLVGKAELDIPKAKVQAEVERLKEKTRADLRQRGMKDVENIPIMDDVFLPRAEQAVRTGLVVSAFVAANGLDAKPEQIKAYIEEISTSYERPAEVVRWYYSDKARMEQAQSMVVESNVIQFVLSRAQVTEKVITFDELMAQS